MQFKQFYLGCLAHASYIVASNGEAAVIDPQRDVEQYIEQAGEWGVKIRYIIETHLHADFVSGHQELARRTGAEIVFGAKAEAEIPHRAVGDGDELRIGEVTMRAIETPGHTPEGISWLIVSDFDGIPDRVLTGDTLFIGDVGRPDLAGARGYTSEQMAGLLYDSLHTKLLTLPDEVEVYPAHGAGSACGRNISKETSSTIGQQRRMNYALQPMSREEFIRMMTADLAEPPRYFLMDVEINRRGAGSLDSLESIPRSAEEVKVRMDAGSTVLDVRDAAAYGAGHLPGSINIALGGQYASWSGSLLSPENRVLIVCEGTDQAKEAVTRLARVGLETVDGFLDGGIATWEAAGYPVACLPQIAVSELKSDMERERELQIVDVRARSEFEAGHVPRAINLPLAELDRGMDRLDRDTPVAVICAGGYRSSAAASLLERSGFQDLRNVVGGTAAWIRSGFPTESQ